MSRIPSRRKKELDGPRLSFFHILFLVGLFGLIFGAALLVKGIYLDHRYNAPVRTVTKIVPVPAANVNGEIIFYSDVAELASFVASQKVDSEDPFADALEISIKRKHTEQFAEQFGIDQDQLLNEYTATLDYPLIESLGWSEKLYKRLVLGPLLVAQRLEEEVYASSEHQEPSRLRMEGVLTNVEVGIDFTDLAIQSSEGGAAAAGGDVGYLKKEDLDEGLLPLFDVEVDEVSEILEAPTYFAIGYVYDAIEVEDERVQIGVQMITINKLTLAEVLETYVPEQDVGIYLR